MLTKLLKQFNSRSNLVKSPSYRYRKNISAVDFLNDIYPFGQDYFHEMNPIISISLMGAEQLKSSRAVTLRDGAFLLADFLLKNTTTLNSLGTNIYVNHHLPKLIPAHLKERTGIWKIVQNESFTTRKKFKTLFIQGVISDFAINLEFLKNELDKVSNLDFEEVKIYLPSRKSPFELPWLENYVSNETIELIKSYFPNQKLINLKTKDLFETSQWSGTYSIDLLDHANLLSDQFMNFEILSRGGVVNHIDHIELENKIFEIDLSFYHKIQFAPLPEVDSLFPELLFLKKKSKQKHLVQDQEIVSFIKEKVLL